MYKQASRMKLRFQTSKGNLSVEQLWDLSLTDLASAIKSVNSVIKESEKEDELSFLNTEEQPDSIAQTQFNILKDIYVTKSSEIEDHKTEREVKAYNQKILALIKEKEDGWKAMLFGGVTAYLCFFVLMYKMSNFN